jgi:integrase
MSVYKGSPTKDGRCYYFRKSKNGKQFTSKKYLTKEECEKAESKFILKNDNPINKSFVLIAEDFLNNLRKYRKESTADAYKQVYNKHIYPYFKSFYINNINVQHIRKWAEMIENQGISTNYMNIAYNTLKGIFNYGIKNYGLTDNPVQLYGRFQTKQENKKKEKLRYITKEEFDKFISVINDSLWKTWFITIWFTGCRK